MAADLENLSLNGLANLTLEDLHRLPWLWQLIRGVASVVVTPVLRLAGITTRTGSVASANTATGGIRSASTRAGGVESVTLEPDRE